MSSEVHSYQFDTVVLDVPAGRVIRDGQDVELEPKAFDLLVLLVSRPGELLTKQDLLDAVWPGVFVTDNAIARVVAQLRRALGDSARGARYIETVPTRGYRFVAPVQVIRGRPLPARREPLLVPPEDAVASRPAPRPASMRHLYVSAVFGLVAVAALVMAWMAQQQARERSDLTGELTRVQVTSSPALDTFPAWSPDGRRLAYASDRTGTFELHVRSMIPGGQRLALTTDGQRNVQPAWSPDGQQIAYHSVRRGGIWVVGATGGMPRQLTTFGSRPAWSPDGGQIAFQAAPFTEPNAGAFEAFGPSSLWLVAAEGGPPRQLTRPWEPQGGHVRPSWWPDGRHLLFASQDVGTTTLYRLDISSGSTTEVFASDTRVLDATLAADGRTVYYVRMDDHFDLWRLTLSETHVADTPAVRVLPPGELDVRHVSISPDGRQLAYCAMSAISGLRVQDLDQRGLPVGTSARLAEDAVRSARRPSMAPDGRSVVFERASAGLPPAVWLLSLTTGTWAQLTPPGMEASEPDWSPDGREVYFQSGHDGTDRIWAADVASGQVRPLTRLGRQRVSLLRPRLSPDGRWLAYTTTAQGRLEVRVEAASGGGARTVARGGDGAAFPVWSPDGSALAFGVWNDGTSQVYVADLASGVPVPVTSDVEQAWVRSWSPDGRRLAFSALQDGRWNVWWTTRDGSTQQRVTDYTDEHHYVRNPVWSPTGTQLIYEFASVAGNIWVVNVEPPE